MGVLHLWQRYLLCVSPSGKRFLALHFSHVAIIVLRQLQGLENVRVPFYHGGFDSAKSDGCSTQTPSAAPCADGRWRKQGQLTSPTISVTGKTT